MPNVPFRPLMAAIFPGLAAGAGTAFLSAILFAVAGLWLDGHGYSWHHIRYQAGPVDMGAFDLLMVLASAASGLAVGITIIRRHRK